MPEDLPHRAPQWDLCKKLDPRGGPFSILLGPCSPLAPTLGGSWGWDLV